MYVYIFTRGIPVPRDGYSFGGQLETDKHIQKVGIYKQKLRLSHFGQFQGIICSLLWVTTIVPIATILTNNLCHSQSIFHVICIELRTMPILANFMAKYAHCYGLLRSSTHRNHIQRKRASFHIIYFTFHAKWPKKYAHFGQFQAKICMLLQVTKE